MDANSIAYNGDRQRCSLQVNHEALQQSFDECGLQVYCTTEDSIDDMTDTPNDEPSPCTSRDLDMSRCMMVH